jgi:type I restriction enzyme, S subunit
MSSRDGWTREKFGDVVRNVSDTVRDPAGAGIERAVGLEHLDPGELAIRRWASTGDGLTFTRRFRAGQVLYGRRRVYQRKAAVPDFDGVCSGDIYVFEPTNRALLPELLPYIVQSEPFHQHALRTSAGSLSPRTKWTDLREYEFDLPPIDEQREISQLLSATGTSRRAIETLIAKLRRARSELFSERSQSSARLQSIGELVDSGVLLPPQDGNHGEKHPKAADFSASGVPFLTASDLSNGRLDLDRCKFIPESLARSLRVGFAKAGDVLLTHKGTVGLTTIVPATVFPFLMLSPQVTYYRVEDRQRLEASYLHSFFASQACQSQLSRLGKQSTRAYVSIRTQRKVRVPVIDIEEQRELVEHLAKIDESIATLEAQLVATRDLARAVLDHELGTRR